ncbi:host cell division inhibitor Icd-like protein [Proteus myxofaciens]|uniref:Phage immunity repressor protein n=1 Tax=Proteus myxofaciens ATCC 19692 TaxID=1354337 RepID=A0A198FD77_9GAMM|nr:host cell division inhibitor Icd-like protein [Proteus myxofaciens]OAT22838.1 phage immunity repressor protein [Proteus myxofaciens ATCC 19692]
MITLCSIKGIACQVNDSLLVGGESVKVDTLLSILNLTSSYSQSDKLSSDHSVNILAQKSAKILADVSAKIYANQAILTTNGGWDSSENLKRGEFTPFAKGDFSHLSKEANYSQSQGLIGVTTRDRIEFLESIKKDSFVKCAIHHLRLWVIVGYSKNALAKSSVRIETLYILKVTHDAPCVFFCVCAYAHLQFAVLYRSNSMVMLAGQPKGWLVSFSTSSLNPVSVTTPIEIETSGGDSLDKLKEIIVMMATPTQTQFKFLFLSIKRSDTTAKPCRITVTAPNEHDARLMLVRDYILSFAGRLPAKAVANA